MPRNWQWGVLLIALIALSGCAGSTAPAGGAPPADTELDYELTVGAGSSLTPSGISGAQVSAAAALGAGGGQLPPGFDPVQGLYFTPPTGPDEGFSADLNLRVEREHQASQIDDGTLLYLYYSGAGGLMFVDGARVQAGWVRFHVTMLGYFVIAENPSLPAAGDAFATFAFADLESAQIGEQINCWAVAVNGSAPYAFSWEMGDGMVLSGDQVSHAYSANGAYTIRVTATDAAQHSTSAFSTPVTVEGGGVEDLLVVIAVQQDPNDPLRFIYSATVTGGVPPYNFSWDFDGDGSEDSNSGPQVDYTYPGPGFYPVTVNVTDDAGSGAQGESAADVRALALSAAPLSGVAPLDVQFAIEALGFNAGDEITLEFGDTGSSVVTVSAGQTDYQDMHTYEAGSFMAMATGVSQLGGTQYSIDSNEVSLVVIALPDKPVLQLTQPLLPSPDSGFRLAGYALGDSQGGRTVMLDTTPLTVTSWSDTAVELAYPTGFSEPGGMLTVDNPTEGASNPLMVTLNRQALPQGIQNILPLRAQPGGRLLVIGHGFGFVEMSVELGGTAATVEEWGDNAIVAQLSPAQALGVQTLVVGTGAGAPDLTASVEVTDPLPLAYPTLSGANPLVVEIGTGGSMELSGLDFGDGYGGLVLGCGLVFPVNNWTDMLIEIGDPPASVDCGVVVLNRDLPSNPLGINYINRPRIDSLEPDFGAVGDQIAVNGQYFGIQRPGDQVLLGGTALTVSSWTDTRIDAVLPAGVSDGEIIVLKALSSNGVPFDVVPPPPDPPNGQQL